MEALLATAPSAGLPDLAPSLSAAAANVIIVVCGFLGLLYALWATIQLRAIVIDPALCDEERISLTITVDEKNTNNSPRDAFQRVFEITSAITEGAKAFLAAEYRYMAAFVVVFSVVVLVLLGAVDSWTHGIFTMLAFILGSLTSIISGWIGMRIAVFTNGRTALEASQGYPSGFRTAFQGGIVMGFALSSLGLLNLWWGIALFYLYFHGHDSNVYPDTQYAVDMFACISAFGLGGSSIALFGRVGGGIFTKAADVGADLVGKVEQNIPEDDPRNPGVIADCIGDNVGDIAGMGSDLFGSFAESTCAALVIESNTELATQWACMMYPLLISAAGIFVCILTSLLATHIRPATSRETIEPTLRYQLIVSAILATASSIIISAIALPSSFKMEWLNDVSTPDHIGTAIEVKWWYCAVCVLTGLWGGLIIGITTEYYTSNRYKPVADVADASKTGAATNIIYGLALGYQSCIIPAITLAVIVYINFNLASLFGIALGALGILSTMSIGLTIDAYGPIADNAGGIAEMAGLGPEVRERTDALDAAGNTTAAIGKGYAIGSAALVGLALYGAFLTRTFSETKNPGDYRPAFIILNIVDPRTFFGLMIGSMLPFWFSAMTMKSVGLAAMEMVREIQRQFKTIPGLMEGEVSPDYASCVNIATSASLKEMLPPGALVVLSPIFFGVVFGAEALGGLLPGSLIAGVQMAISASNTGGAWDNAKKFVEAGLMEGHGKGSDVHKAAVIGDTVGDPLKDTSGPALNILIKLMAIISVVFAPTFKHTSSIGGVFFNKALKGWVSRDGPTRDYVSGP